MVAGLSIAVVAGAVGLRLRAVNRQKRELQRQVEARTGELKAALRELEESREAAERTAVLEERQRLARELHDSVTQLLYGQVLSADISYKYLKKGDLAALEKNLVKLQEIAGQSLKEMRLLLYELRPSSFEEEGLANALDVRLDAVERRSRIESSLEVSGPVDLSPAVAWEVYRIAIEALNNSLKHAEASRVAVSLQSSDGFMELEVRDNGRGFVSEDAEKGGFGINSMRQRAEGIGGRLEIESEPGRGTRVWVKVPKA
jgi:signal transduction histidine kinase